MKYLKLFEAYNPNNINYYNQNEISTIMKFLQQYELYQSNHYGNYDYEYFHDIYLKLPDNFKYFVRYTSRNKLYRGQETSKIPDKKVLSFTKSYNYANFIGNIIISSKDIDFTYTTVDSEKIVKFIDKNKLSFEIGDDESEVLIIKIKL